MLSLTVAVFLPASALADDGWPRRFDNADGTRTMLAAARGASCRRRSR
ncbi:hypothetical protein WJ969_23750 [Achromobacter xylosoxidans]